MVRLNAQVVIADYVRSEYALKHSREQGDLQLEGQHAYPMDLLSTYQLACAC